MRGPFLREEVLAISQASQKEETWEKSVELERIGGRVVVLPIENFKSFGG